VVEDYDEPVFYADGYFWLYRDGWYRSSNYSGGWVRFQSVPQVVLRIERPRAYVHYRASAGARVRQGPRGPVSVRDQREDVRDHRDDMGSPAQERREEKAEEKAEKREEKAEEKAEKREEKQEQREVKAEAKAEEKAERPRSGRTSARTGRAQEGEGRQGQGPAQARSNASSFRGSGGAGPSLSRCRSPPAPPLAPPCSSRPTTRPTPARKGVRIADRARRILLMCRRPAARRLATWRGWRGRCPGTATRQTAACARTAVAALTIAAIVSEVAAPRRADDAPQHTAGAAASAEQSPLFSDRRTPISQGTYRPGSAHRLQLIHGTGAGYIGVGCDSGDACDALELRAFVGGGVIGCTGGCAPAAVAAGRPARPCAGRRCEADHQPLAELRAALELGRAVRLRLGGRLETSTPTHGDEKSTVRPVLEVGVISAF
jgi:hypothetical protein